MATLRETCRCGASAEGTAVTLVGAEALLHEWRRRHQDCKPLPPFDGTTERVAPGRPVRVPGGAMRPPVVYAGRGRDGRYEVRRESGETVRLTRQQVCEQYPGVIERLGTVTRGDV